MLELPAQLRAVVKCPPDQKLEAYRRCYLAPKIYVGLFEATLQDQAKKAYSKFLQCCFSLDKEAPEAMAESLEEEFQLPEFILTHYEYWMIVLKYIAYGNSDIERNLSKSDYDTAKEKALIAIREEIQELFEVSSQSLESILDD